MASSLKQTNVAQDRARKFLDHVGQKVSLYPSGIVFYKSKLGPFPWRKTKLSTKFREFLVRCDGLRQRNRLWPKSIGYHSFNLYAYALLKQNMPDHPFWERSKMRKMLDVTESNRFQELLEKSPYVYPYNPPGIEIAFVLDVFGGEEEKISAWLQRQFDKTYDHQSGELLTRGVADTETSAARLYELTRLSENYDGLNFSLPLNR